MPITGFENSLYVDVLGTMTEIDLAREVTINKEKGEIDASCRKTVREGWEASEDGLKKWSADFDSLVPAPDEAANLAFSTLQAAFMDNTTVTILRVRGGTIADDDCYAEQVSCGVFGGTEGEPLKEMMTIAYSLKAKDVPLIGTVSGGAFVEYVAPTPTPTV